MTDLTTIAAELEALQERLRASVMVQRGEPLTLEYDGRTYTGTTGDTVAARNPDGPAAADAIGTLLAALKAQEEENTALHDHIAEQIQHVEQRIEDGKQRGATIWRLALEDVARENRATRQDDVVGLSEETVAAIIDRVGREGDFAWTCRQQLRRELATLIERLSSPPEAAMVGETWASINQWCDDTFGKATIPQIIGRAKEEFVELETEGANHAIEAADVVICLCRIPGFAEALQTKMAINRKRKWRLVGNGTGYHIPDGSPKQGGE